MNSLFLIVSFAVGVAASLFAFGVLQWRASRGQTLKAIRDEMVAAAEEARHARTWRQRATDALKTAGWQGPPLPLIWLTGLVYLLVAVAMSQFGVGGWIGVLAAAPVTALLGFMVTTLTRNRRRRAFDRQLTGAFDQLAAKLRAGASPSRAFEDLAPSLPEPLRSEVLRALDIHRSSVPLSEAMAGVAARYPSRPMSLFITALRVGELRGGAIAPAIEMAAATIREDAELRAEALSEVSQEKAQALGIIGLVGFLAASTIGRSSPEVRSAFLSPVGMLVLGVAVANYALGIVRILKKLSNIQKV